MKYIALLFMIMVFISSCRDPVVESCSSDSIDFIIKIYNNKIKKIDLNFDGVLEDSEKLLFVYGSVDITNNSDEDYKYELSNFKIYINGIESSSISYDSFASIVDINNYVSPFKSKSLKVYWVFKDFDRIKLTEESCTVSFVCK